MQVCNDKTVARQVCNTAPQEVCGLVQVPVTKFVDEEECANVNTRKCLPATRQECSDVVEQVGLIILLFSYTSLTSSLPAQVPRQTFETECNTELVEDCSDSSSPRSGSSGYN